MLTTMMMTMAAAAAAAAPQAATPAQPVDLTGWVEQVNKQLADHMRVPSNGDTGLATVVFTRDENGRPVQVSVRSGNPAVARAAIRTIKAAGPLPALPAATPANQRIRFNFLVGMQGREADYARTMARLLDTANRTNVALATRLATARQLASR